MDEATEAPARIPPRWFVRTAWVVHRAIYRVTGGRKGLSTPKPGSYGMMRLHTVGRRSGKERVAIVAYYEDGPDLVTLAMNGWADPPPAWWLNLKSNPITRVDLPDGEERAVRAREAHGVERERLWAGYKDYWRGDLDRQARLRSHDTPVVVFEPVGA
ncbi:nitroreductase/quinone reductase family protein [Microbacterium immunditiarum]|uniref:Deazaflavin-dependent oxidoreductase (Nitroreductase family) n=1 Tax=Microbacterium immunditiarum TaxID=337480 RepID=A0A7Y9KKC6_9MICO|nr:nitroreductase/quinone reductase family protein [Microbacterium immunditiarum]NYE20695.1 deazaflavin-dependent oxidoreductase (nitroreductase family) [Microbacterium immunditiarum]